MTQQLLRRDLPLQPGRKLRFTFTIVYEVPLDEDLLQGETSAPLDEVERWLGVSSENIWKACDGQYDRYVIEHDTTLADLPAITWDDPDYEAKHSQRFETGWEAKERERGNKGSRIWLDEIPAPSVGASA